MKKKVHNVGTIRDRDLKKRIRKELPPPPRKHKSRKDYNRKNKIEEQE